MAALNTALNDAQLDLAYRWLNNNHHHFKLITFVNDKN